MNDRDVGSWPEWIGDATGQPATSSGWPEWIADAGHDGGYVESDSESRDAHERAS